MKTSVIKVGDMLSVWSLDEVESRIGEVPGVESVTVNFAAHSDTSDQVFRRHMISHSGVSDHPEMTPSGAVW